VKIHNAFRLGLLGGLGVLVAVAIGAAVAELSTIITYIGAALFLALGIDPAVSWLERHRFRRPVAILTVILGILAVFVGLIFAVVPVITDQVGALIDNLPGFFKTITTAEWLREAQDNIPFIDLKALVSNIQDWLNSNITTITGGVLQVGLGIFSGITGIVIIFILTLYFVASLSSMKRGLYRLVPASRRAGFSDLAEQISASVGRYVIGQGTIAFLNGVFSFIYLSIMSGLLGVKYPALFAFIAFLFALVPLVGTLTGSIIITLSTLALAGPPAAIAVGIYYLVYMQIEAYVINPRVMTRAVKVPGALVVIAALAGGALLGILGALIAIPVAAAVLLIIDQVVVPRQNEL
jgi:predicted PurR-regulated permease PerM